jgi:anthranilate synthase component 2
MKIALIDHNDSFTYNLVELIRKINGKKPDVLVTGQFLSADLEKYDKIILSPGPGLPKDFIHTMRLLDTYKHHKHIFGICLGHQAIAYYFGAKLGNLKKVVHGQQKNILIKNHDVLFNHLPEQIQVGLYHSWIVSTTDFPDELLVTAEGENQEIMAFRHKSFSIFGVQFHPESFLTPYGHQILQNFLKI